MKTKRLTARSLPLDDLRSDLPRRFRNAVLTITLSHPRGLYWIQENMPRRLLSTWAHPEVEPNVREYVMLVEAVARHLILKNYSFFYCKTISHLIFHDWPITDRGNLSPG